MMCVDEQEVIERGCLHHRYLRWSIKAMLPDATKTQIYMNIYQTPHCVTIGPLKWAHDPLPRVTPTHVKRVLPLWSVGTVAIAPTIYVSRR